MPDAVPGVSFTAPPVSLMADATRVLESMTAQLPPAAKGAIVGLATEAGWNAAVVHRVGEGFVVSSWVGKSWRGGLTGGGAIRATW